MKHRLGSTAIVLLFAAIASLAMMNVAHGDSSIPIVDRKLFFSGAGTQPRSLSLSPLLPSGSTTAANLTRTELKFEYQSLIQTNGVTVSSPMSLYLWMNSTTRTNVDLTGALHEKPPGGTDLPLTNSTVPVTVTSGPPTLYKLNFTQPDQSLLVYSTISVGLRIDSNANVTLFWGSSSNPSYAVLRFSGYQYLSPNNPFQVLDSSQHSSNTFDLNSTYPNNIVYFQASVSSAFGFYDIGNVTLTVLDPLLRTVKTEIMTPVSAPAQAPPYVFTTSWSYSSNAAPGVYDVNILIVDAQNSASFKVNHVATFGLSRSTIFTRALNLIPYFGVGAGAIVAGVVYLSRRRTKKSYLVPFDYFNTLTSGELDGGTAVTIEGNTGAGKTLLTEQLMFEDLRRGRPCVFVSTGDFPANIRANMRGMGLDTTGYEQNGLLTFVDGYSAEAGQQSPEKFSIPSLGDLTTLGMKISSSLPLDSFKGGSLYFDSLTPLVSKAKPESLVSFVQSVGARIKGMGGKAFFTIGPSIDSAVQKQLEEMADCVVQMEAFEERGVRKSRLRIAKYRARRHQQGWVLYSIEDGRGIIFYSKKARQQTL